MRMFAYRILAVSLVITAMVGCKPNEANHSDSIQEETKEVALTLLTVGMSVADANEVLRHIGLIATEEDSGSAMVGAPESRKFRVGVNAQGDALFFMSAVSEDGTENVTDMFWHEDWVNESSLPKSERTDALKDVDEVNLNDDKLTTTGSKQRIEEVDSDPFGG